MNELTTKRRDWIKNFAIVFLIIMLILTFFSNTIMNYSLPEVSAQYMNGGSIEARVRGSGIVTADDIYSVLIDETRTVESVLVKEGDTVEKGQVLLYLQGTESPEYEAAVEALKAAELAYEQALLGADVSAETANNVENGNTTSFDAYKAQVDAVKVEIEKIEAEIASYQTEINYLNNQLTLAQQFHKDNSTEQAAYQTAVTNREAAEAAWNSAVSALAAASIQVASMDEARNLLSTAQGELTSGMIEAQIDRLEIEVKALQDAVEANKLAYEAAVKAVGTGTDSIPTVPDAEETETTGETAPTEVVEPDTINLASPTSVPNVDEDPDVIAALQIWRDSEAALAAKQGELDAANDNLSDTQMRVNVLGQYVSAYDDFEAKKVAETNAKAAVDSTGPNNSVKIKDYENSLAVYNVNKTDAENRLAKQQEVLSGLTTSQANESNLSASLDKIRELQEDVSELASKAVGGTFEAPITGVIQSITAKAGTDVSAGVEFMTIQPEGNGYSMEVSVTKEQAQRLTVGETAELQNAWYYNDTQIVLVNKRVDAASQGENVILVFSVEGDVSDGQSLSISMGQKSAYYDYLVPNSAIREDNNGKFILVVEQRSSPLGNRYYAVRVDVEVLGSDDTQSAVTGALYGGEFVITTSTQPVQENELVRLAD